MAVYDEIRTERERQDAEWGPGHDDAHTGEDWLALLEQYTTAAQNYAYAPHGTIDRLGTEWRRRLIQVAAVAAAAVESFDRTGGVEPRWRH